MDLTREQWMLIQPLLPPPRPSGGRGRPPLDQRALLNGMLWKLRYQKPWRAVPPRYGSHQACYLYYQAWNRSGLMKRILNTLKHDLMERGGFGLFEWVRNGKIMMRYRGGKYIFYVRSDYIDDWRVSTGLIFYNKLNRKKEPGRYELDLAGQEEVEA